MLQEHGKTEEFDGDRTWRRSTCQGYSISKEVEQEDTETETESRYARAFKKLAHKIEESLVANMDSVWKRAELCQEFRMFLEEGADGSTYQTHLVKTRLTEHFEERLPFHRPQKIE